jgi:predicted hydrocarbon binding protein/KaiC/GvpD/RAD55 family RecA-like ATPase
MSLAKIQEVQDKGVILLVGAPGAGKSTFCHQALLRNISMDRPVILVTTEQEPQEVIKLLRQRGLGETEELNMVDAFTQTVGLKCSPGAGIICANCSDLNSLSIAITKLRERKGLKNALLIFDSLTSPYLFNGTEIIKFMRLFLSKFVSENNAVLATVDEGCGRQEDIGAMESVSDGIMRIEKNKGFIALEVIKHPGMEAGNIEIPLEPKLEEFKYGVNYDRDVMLQFFKSLWKGSENIRKEVGDYVNLFWPNLAHWSCMLWDPKEFPKMIYKLNRYEGSIGREIIPLMPMGMRIPARMMLAAQSVGLFVPKIFNTVKNMKLFLKTPLFLTTELERSGVVKYLDNISKTDEHYFRVYDNSDCCGFENIGCAIASHIPPMIAGGFKGMEIEQREWNAIETKCIGLGDPYCEFKLVPREIEELEASLEKDISVIKKIHERLIERLLGFILEEKPLVNRPKLGSDVHLHVVMHGMGFPHLAGERYKMAQRMGGSRTGREIGKRLMDTGLDSDEALRRVFNFMDYCKVGKITRKDNTIRIIENCECMRTKLFTRIKEPSCYFTTGFLNGLLLAAKQKRVMETKCIVAGDPYCEWEIV